MSVMLGTGEKNPIPIGEGWVRQGFHEKRQSILWAIAKRKFMGNPPLA